MSHPRTASRLSRTVSVASLAYLESQCCKTATAPKLSTLSRRTNTTIFPSPFRQPRLLLQPQSNRPFSTTLPTQKKGGKALREASRASPSADTTAPDPHDLTTLSTALETVLTKLRTELSSLRPGGRFNPSTLESLRVQPQKSDKKTYPLRDLAQVIPKPGRTVQILVSEEAYVKAVASAVQSAGLNLTPVRDETVAGGLGLSVTVPAPTAESRKLVVAEAGRLGDVAAGGVRNARGEQQKRLRALGLDKAFTPDYLKKGAKLMEDRVEKASAEVKGVVEKAKRALDQ